MTAAGIEASLLSLLAVFILAAGVGVFVAKVGRFPYTIALLLAGLAVSILGVEIGLELSHDMILLVLLPPLLFEGAATTDLARFRANIVPILVLAVPGLIISVLILGFAGQFAFGFPLLIALLFAATILPTDPVSVLALFEELGAPRRLSILVEGESLLNDGVGVVVFSALLAIIVETGTDPAALFTPEKLATVGVDIAIASLGGLVVGLAAGYAVFRVMANLDEHMTEIVLTLILAYGSFLLAEHYLHVSGVIATVSAGLFIGNRGAEYAMSPQTKIAVFNTWETAAFLVNTLIFLLIGAKTPVTQLVTHLPLIAVAIVLVVVVRALTVYPLLSLTNLRLDVTVPRSYQHVAVWGGLHASIPIALVLGLPPSIPFREELRAMVFGVAAFSLVVQGLSMERLLDALDIVTRSDEEELYELLVGRARAVDNALEAAEELRRTGAIPPDVYEQFTTEYEAEKDDLNRAISSLLTSHPQIHREELLIGERQVLKREKSAIMDAMRTGTLSDDVGEKLLEEVDLKLSRVNAGESTVTASPDVDGYEEFWRAKAAEFGLDVDAPTENETDREPNG
ncbi:Na+/H+ antiporter [Haladaptatus sp. CMSO5]|uniref:Na+/H+ antiporter n=1 Tax=Haladaptatus sp. CMSO5 TaxID=3120514 RepID=UPI002FCE4A37